MMMSEEQIDAYCDDLAKSGSEHSNQVAFFAWLAFKQNDFPQGRMAFAVPNGGTRGDDEKSRQIRGGKLKAEGVKSGVPDIYLPVPSFMDRSVNGHVIVGENALRFAGLFIEMKIGNGRLSEEQKAWHGNLRAHQYAVATCWGWRAAKQCFLDYVTTGALRRVEYKEPCF